jgi:hypothetical protein
MEITLHWYVIRCNGLRTCLKDTMIIETIQKDDGIIN